MYYLDYSAKKLAGATIKSAGYPGVIRYIDSPARLSTKHTNLAEYSDHIANGLDVRLIMQVGKTDADLGYAGGVDHAQRALDGARYLGYKKEIYFPNDRPDLPDPGLWHDFLNGAASVLGWTFVGAYGFYNALDVAAHMTPCQHFWGAGRWSDISQRPYVNFWQDNNTQVTVGGVVCDRNLVLREENDMTPDESAALFYVRDQLKLMEKRNVDGGKPFKLAGDLLMDGAYVRTGLALDALTGLKTDVAGLANKQVDVNALADAIVAKLPAGLKASLSDEDVKKLALAVVSEQSTYSLVPRKNIA